MTKKRRYDDGCATAHAMDIIGDRWALLIVRELVFGPKRFTDLQASLPAIAPNVLTQRLEELESSQILEKKKLPPPFASTVYELTPWGHDLEPLIKAIGKWAAQSPNLPKGAPMSINSVLLSFSTMFNPGLAKNLTASIQFKFGDQTYYATIDREKLTIEAGEVDSPDVTIEGDQNALAAVVYGGESFDSMIRSGAIEMHGNKRVARRFASLFPLPSQIPRR